MRLQLARNVARAALPALTICSFATRSRADTGEVELGSHLFFEPSATSQLTVINPAVGLTISPWSSLGVIAGYEADIVSGATESVKQGPLGGPDVISAATEFRDTRHIGTGGLILSREQTHIEARYSYGTERDYRSHAVSVSAGTTFFRNNTELELGYARGFDSVCTSAFRVADAPSTRAALESAEGCFKSTAGQSPSERERAPRLRKLNLDNLQLGWTQAWTPVLTTQLVATGALQNGFLGNPYRAVVISSAGETALENHPENRARIALALRARWYLRSLRTAFGIGVRGYDDTWDVLAQSYEVSAERHLVSWLRLRAEGRFSTQTGALFWSDDYTGGEPENGPRGRYWSGDRELSPLKSYWLGLRATGEWSTSGGSRLLGIFLRLKVAVSASLLKTELESFTLGGQTPDDTLGLLGGLSTAGAF